MVRDRASLPRIYIDSSAYLAVLLGEKSGELIEKQIRNVQILSSIILLLEVRRNLVRLTRNGFLNSTAYQDCMQRFDTDAERMSLLYINEENCGVLPMPPVAVPRSLDLLHLRSALQIHLSEPLNQFISLDIQQLAAARELGLPVS